MVITWPFTFGGFDHIWHILQIQVSSNNVAYVTDHALKFYFIFYFFAVQIIFTVLEEIMDGTTYTSQCMWVVFALYNGFATIFK